MTYCSAAGLEDDSRALQVHADPFKMSLQGHQLTPKQNPGSGKAQVVHRGPEPGSKQCYDLSWLIVLLPLIIPSLLIVSAPALD